MIAVLRKLRRREDGAIALATFAFMIFAGFIVLLTLWGIAYTTGAYNALYAANQSAAYAAATVTRPASDQAGGNGGAQLSFACDNRGEVNRSVVCFDDPERDGEAIDAAQEVLAASLGGTAEKPGPFGLYYDPNSSDRGVGAVRLVGPGGSSAGQGDAITVHEVWFRPADAAAFLRQNDELCPADPADREAPETGYVELLEGTEQLACWRLREGEVVYPPQVRSGVVTRAEAKLPLLPFCTGGTYCPTFTLRTAAAATLDRPATPEDWSGYYPAQG